MVKYRVTNIYRTLKIKPSLSGISKSMTILFCIELSTINVSTGCKINVVKNQIIK